MPNDNELINAAEEAFADAASKGQVDVMRRLAYQHALDLDKPDQYGKTPLYYAANNGHLSAVICLLKLQARVDVQNTDDNRSTPLIAATREGYVDIVKKLLESAKIKRIDIVSATNAEGDTALHVACNRGLSEIAQVLLMHHANPFCKANDGMSAFDLAKEKYPEIANFISSLSEYFPNSDDLNPKENRDVALSHAAEDGNDIVLQWLLEGGDIHLNVRNSETGYTPLMYAARDGHLNAVNLLLNYAEKNGIDIIDMGNNRDDTALLLAAYYGRTEVVKALLDRGADPSVTDRDGFTPAQLATRQGHIAVAELFTPAARLERLTERGYKMSEKDATELDDYLCPITQVIMANPVMIASSQKTFERAALIKHYTVNQECPLTRKPIVETDLDNHDIKMKEKIETFVRRQEQQAKLQFAHPLTPDQQAVSIHTSAAALPQSGLFEEKKNTPPPETKQQPAPPQPVQQRPRGRQPSQG